MKITVEASSSRRVAAERARVHTEALWEAATRQRAVSGVSKVVASLTSELEGLANKGVESYSASPARVSTWRPSAEDGRRAAPRTTAVVELVVVFDNLEVLSKWAVANAEREGLTINHVEWLLTESTAAAVEEEVLAGALERARGRALSLAKADGAAGVETISVTDRGSATPQLSQPMMSRAAGYDSAEDAQVSVVPELIGVEASLVVRFQTLDAPINPRRSRES